MSLTDLGLFSLVSFVLTLLLVPLLLVGLPADYFDRPYRRAEPSRHSLLHLALIVVKNLAGLALVLLGIVLLVLPGQGLLTILLGVILLDFPGKYALERRLVRRPGLLHPINRLRRRCGRQPLRVSPPE